MKLVGLILAIFGWLLPVVSLNFVSSTTVRMVLALLGIGISLVGILGLLNRSHVQDAIWKR
ncbi:MAG TPA: hypothetical protein VFC10_17940 [Terriglobia bacterium]|nr:hypothetical protein [Terriglobia bacterium]